MRTNDVPLTFVIDIALRTGLMYWLYGKFSDKIRNWFGNVPGVTDIPVSGKIGLSMVLGIQSWMLSPEFLRLDSSNPATPYLSSALSTTGASASYFSSVASAITPSNVSIGNPLSFAATSVKTAAHGALSAIDYAAQTGPAKLIGSGAGSLLKTAASAAYNNMFCLGILGFEGYWVLSIMETKKQLEGLRIQSNLPYMAAACCAVPMATACVAPALVSAGVTAACFIPAYILDQAAQHKITAHYQRQIP